MKGLLIKFETPELAQLLPCDIANETLETKDKKDNMFKIKSKPILLSRGKSPINRNPRPEPTFITFSSFPFTLQPEFSTGKEKVAFRFNSESLHALSKNTLLTQLLGAHFDAVNIMLLIMSFLAGAGIGFIVFTFAKG